MVGGKTFYEPRGKLGKIMWPVTSPKAYAASRRRSLNLFLHPNSKKNIASLFSIV